MQTKICIKCNRELPLTNQYYPRDKACKDGYRNVCRECQTGHYNGFLPDGYEKPPRWTKEEKQMLRDNYALYTNKELQEIFFPNRTIQAIISQANTLKIGGKLIDTYWREHEERLNGVYDNEEVKSMPEEWKQKMSKSKKEYFEDHNSSRKGMSVTDTQRQLMKMRREGAWVGDSNPRHVNPLNGENNGRWKGGINPVYIELRSELKEWQKSSMEFCNYTCVITGGRFDVVHHVVPFRDIVDEVFSLCNIPVRQQVCDYTDDEMSLLRLEIKNVHIKYGFGACLNKDVHKLFHDTYGYAKCKKDNFIEFIHRIDNGEFNDWFIENNLKVSINQMFIDYLKSEKIYE